MANTEFENVTKDRPCENCGKHKYCSRSKDGYTVICRFQPIPGGDERQDKNGAQFFIRTNKVQQNPHPPFQTIGRASSRDLHRVYSRLLEMLDLDALHLKDCEHRGLKAHHVVTRNFKSLPIKNRTRLYHELEKLFGNEILKAVPGVIFKDGKWTLGGTAGMLVPVKNASGEIVALLIKVDKPIDGNKYLWLSSTKYGGPGSGAPPHVPISLVEGSESIVHIVEGVLKAEVFSALTGEPSIGISGVGNWKPAVEILEQFKLRKVILALDADASENPNVARPLLEMFNELSSQGLDVGYKFWDPKTAKGIDDALVAKAEIKLLWGSEAKAAIMDLPSLNKKDGDRVSIRPEVAHGIIQMNDLIQKTRDVILEANNPPTLFLRGNRIVKLTDNGRQLLITEVDQAMMFGHLVRSADWFQESIRVAKGIEYTVRKTSQPPKDLVTDLLVYSDDRLPKLNSVSDTPLIGKSGFIVVTPGYDSENSIFLDEKRLLKLPSIKLLTKTELEEKVRFLRHEVFGDFPFASERDFTNIMVLMLTVVLREVINGPTPMFVVNATAPGAGKSLLSELVSLIVLGVSSDAKAIPGNDDELRKSITSILLQAPKIVLFDNADQEAEKIHSPALAAALTSTIWSDRRLARNEVITVENRSVFVLTGNNVNLTSELSRRSVEIKLEPSSSRPWERDGFKHKNIREWVLANRSNILHALLSVCHSWIVEGAQSSEKTLGSFEAWARVVGGVTEYLGLAGFLESQGRHRSQVDLETEEWESFVQAWWDEFKIIPRRASELYFLCERRELLTGILGVGSERSRQTKLGIELANKRGRIFGGFRIEQSRNAGGHGKFYAIVSTRLSQVPHGSHHVESAEHTHDLSRQGNLDDLLVDFENLKNKSS